MDGFKSILVVVVDDSTTSRHLVRDAATLAHRDGAEITVAQVIEPLPDLVAGHVPDSSRLDLQERMVAERFHRLNEWARQLLKRRIGPVATVVLVGTPFLEIIRRVEREGHDLVVLAGEPPSSSHRLSSTALHLLRKCPAPVWLLRAKRRSSVARVGAALAEDRADPARQELNRRILTSALSVARDRQAEVIAVHAWDVADEGLLRTAAGLSRSEADVLVDVVRVNAQQWLHELLQDVPTDGVRLRAATVKGPASHQLPRFARRHRLDLIVLGTVSHLGIPGLIMSETAEDIAQQVDCEILALKPPGFVSPVSAAT